MNTSVQCEILRNNLEAERSFKRWKLDTAAHSFAVGCSLEGGVHTQLFLITDDFVKEFCSKKEFVQICVPLKSSFQ